MKEKYNALDLVVKAIRTNRARDAYDLATFGACSVPGAGPTDVDIRTIMCALLCGMETSDWNCVAEAFDMLVMTHKRLTGEIYTAWLALEELY